MNNCRNFFKSASAFLCAALLLCMPISVMADGGPVEPLPGDIINIGDASERRGDGWACDGEGTYDVTGDVTVTGQNYDASALTFNISDNHTVTWEAHFNGDSQHDEYVLMDVRGSGTFAISKEGYITLRDSGTAVRTESGISLIVRDYGMINAFGDEYSCIAVRALGSVLVTGDCEVWADSEVGCTAIYADGDVTIETGKVVADSPCGVAIRSDSDIQIKVLGQNSKVWGDGGAILAKQASVTVDTPGGGAIVNATGMLKLVDGELLGNAIMAKNVTLRDNAKVWARNGAAIFFSGKLDMNGGAVFAYGDGIGGASFEFIENPELDPMLNVIFRTPDLEFKAGVEYTDTFDPASSITEDGIALAWDFLEWYEHYVVNEEAYFYDENDTTDIIVYPTEDVAYRWGIAPRGRAVDRIWYSKGNTDDYFFTDLSLAPQKPLKPNPKIKPIENPDEKTGSDGNTRSGRNTHSTGDIGLKSSADIGDNTDTDIIAATGTTPPGMMSISENIPVPLGEYVSDDLTDSVIAVGSSQSGNESANSPAASEPAASIPEANEPALAANPAQVHEQGSDTESSMRPLLIACGIGGALIVIAAALWQFKAGRRGKSKMS